MGRLWHSVFFIFLSVQVIHAQIPGIVCFAFLFFPFTYTYRAINNQSDIENFVIVVIITLFVTFSSTPLFPFVVYTFEDANQLMAFSRLRHQPSNFQQLIIKMGQRL